MAAADANVFRDTSYETNPVPSSFYDFASQIEISGGGGQLKNRGTSSNETKRQGRTFKGNRCVYLCFYMFIFL